MIWSFVYLAVRRIMELLLLCLRSRDAKELEILVLRARARDLPPPAPHTAPRAQGPGPARGTEPSLTPVAGGRCSSLRRPRCLVGIAAWSRRHWTYPNTAKRRPPVPAEVQALIVGLAVENSCSGYQRITGRPRWPRLPSVGVDPTGARANGIDPRSRAGSPRPGVRSCANRPRASSLVTSSPSTGVAHPLLRVVLHRT